MISNDLKDYTDSQKNIYSFLLDGFFTKVQIAEELFYSERTIEKGLQLLMKAGLVEFKKIKHGKTYKKMYKAIEFTETIREEN